ncbi:MAG: hypothetical protein WCB46_09480 [Methanoregula sp.]
MDIIRESVTKVKDILEHGGCGEGDVFLDVNPKAKNCQFEKGACMTASFGGRTADFVTFDPLRACTKIAFMYGAPLDTVATRGAAAAIVNIVTGFFCLSRVLHACPESSHAPCLAELEQEIKGKKVFCVGDIAKINHVLGGLVVQDPLAADIILIGNEGMLAKGTGDLIEQFKGKKPVLCIGSSVAGVSRLHLLEHWCPYGRSK